MATLHKDKLVIKEQFYLPTVLVEISNLQRGQFHCISQEHELTALLIIEESYEPKMLWIAFLAATNCQFNLRIGQYPLG